MVGFYNYLSRLANPRPLSSRPKAVRVGKLVTKTNVDYFFCLRAPFRLILHSTNNSPLQKLQ
ncbi:hypothetical protein I7I51_00859 [Histoplasma capsulatum]|uniref:Uncharacterized protein n=1 Tax=Ajellomyces capsulatus TaxID=5037 RepID=A0A8A1MCY8_AJECA|nr:hypothetical protein I7I51_00859 [Histoplasma capsulatum]